MCSLLYINYITIKLFKKREKGFVNSKVRAKYRSEKNSKVRQREISFWPSPGHQKKRDIQEERGFSKYWKNGCYITSRIYYQSTL